MVRLLSAVLLCFIAVAARAQQDQSTKKSPATQTEQQTTAPARHIDLTRDQQAPAVAPGLKTNPSLLMPAGQSGPQTYKTTQTTTGINGSNTQQVNATSTQFNLGGQKATSTYYYDNTGKMTGSGTSIKIGGKK